MNELTWRGATVAWARPSDENALTETELAAMGERQRERHRELRGERAAGFLAGRALIRELVRRLGGGPDVRLDSTCARCGAAHAVPRTPGFTLSVSHAEDLVAVAIAPGNSLLGIDLERNTRAARTAELAPLFAPAPAPDLAGWTRIEAAIKADGRGIGIDPSTVRSRAEHPLADVPASDPPVWTVALPGRATRLWVTTLAGPPGYTLSVARD